MHCKFLHINPLQVNFLKIVVSFYIHEKKIDSRHTYFFFQTLKAFYYYKNCWHLEQFESSLAWKMSEENGFNSAFYLPQGFSCDTFHNPVPSICHNNLHSKGGLEERLRELRVTTLR